MNARELTFATLASPLARSQTQAVIDFVTASLPRATCRLDVLPSPVMAVQKDDITPCGLSVILQMAAGVVQLYLAQGAPCHHAAGL